MWRRFCGQHQGNPDSFCGPTRAPNSAESGPPRRVWLRSQYGRWRWHPHPDASRVPSQRNPACGHHSTSPRSVRRGHGVLAPGSAAAPQAGDGLREDHPIGRPRPLGLAHRTDRQQFARRDCKVFGTPCSTGLHRQEPGTQRRPSLRAETLRHSQALLLRDSLLHQGRRRVLVHLQPFLPHPRVQGNADDRTGRQVLPGPQEPGHEVRSGTGPLPLQHQHVPELGPFAPLPLHRPQRRDQHAARQHQLDACPRGLVPIRCLR